MLSGALVSSIVESHLFGQRDLEPDENQVDQRREDGAERPSDVGTDQQRGNKRGGDRAAREGKHLEHPTRVAGTEALPGLPVRSLRTHDPPITEEATPRASRLRPCSSEPCRSGGGGRRE